MDGLTVCFSTEELSLLNNAEVILTKVRVQKKLTLLLEGLQDILQKEAYLRRDYAIVGALQTTPKISRGENYNGLPYMVLDFPRQFDLQNIFAIRCMVWWGMNFSITLHLDGEPKESFISNIETAYQLLAKESFYIGVNEDPWQHYFEEDNYLPIKNLSEEKFTAACRAFGHLKIARQWPLWEIQFGIEEWIESWRILIQLCLD